MHLAPSVEYPLGSARLLRRLVLAAWAAVVLVDMGWLWVGGAPGWRWWLALALTGLAASIAWRGQSIMRGGTLHWDGSTWSWGETGQRNSGRVDVVLDLQSALLLHCVAESGVVRWCWPTAAQDPTRWLALRRALVATHWQPSRGNRAREMGPGQVARP